MTPIRLILPALIALALMAGPVRAQTPPETPDMSEPLFVIVYRAGPWGDDGGVIVLRAESLEAARAVMAADPAVTGGLFEGEVRGFDPRFTTDEAIR